MKHMPPYFVHRPRSDRVVPMAFILAWALAMPLLAAPDTPDAVTLYKIYVTDVRDGAFTVSWTTDALSDGYVDWGTTTALGNTTPDTVNSTRTHFVTVPSAAEGLLPNTTYYFRARSNGVIDNNMGDYYAVTTGPTLLPPGSGTVVWGYVYEADGATPAANVPVYLRLEDNNSSGSSGASQWGTTRTESSEVWHYTLDNLRMGSAGAYFTFTDGADKLHIIARGGTLGAAELTTTAPASYPMQVNLILGAPAAPIAPAPTASLIDHTNFRLTWPHQSPDADYEVWRSANPYALPKQAGAHRRSNQTTPYPVAPLAFTDNAAAGNPNANWYYVIRGYDLGGQSSVDSTTAGVFNFALTPGN